MLEELHRVPVVDFHPGLEDAGIHVVSPLLDEGPPLDPLDQLVHFADLQNDDPFDLDIFFQKVGLPDRPRNPIEEEELLHGEVAVRRNQAVYIVMPDLDRHLVRQKEPFTGIIVVERPGGGFRG